MELKPQVQAWEEGLHIPTYEPAAPERLPVFHELRNYQGTRGDIYPLAAVESISDEKTDHIYRACCLENEYVRVAVLPELGGRVYEGYDKTNDYNFVYKNHVIKPALIGLCGPWVSGGIEFNWPQHHRPTTFLPVDEKLVRNPEGSATVWVGEIEPKDDLKGMVGISMEPGRSYIKASVRLYNPTADVKTFHWWANLAVHAGDAYRLVFPPDIDYVTFHYKNFVSPFPIVKGNFANADYGEGRDISHYRNVYAPSSFFIFNSRYNFMAGYDDSRGSGTVHVADRHISPGKKFFTWGTDEFGQVWQKNLTDADGPYIEIMTGCYTDNQPDFAWLAPYETKTFEQYWYPVKDMPHLKNATIDAAVSLGVTDDAAHLAFNATGLFRGARYVLREGEAVLAEGAADISPDLPLHLQVKAGHPLSMNKLCAALYSADGTELVAYHPLPKYFDGRPAPVCHEAAKAPQAIETVEELFFNGLHIEQYRHPTFSAEAYYLEGLRRESRDSRCNLAMGRVELRRGCFEKARDYLMRAVESMTRRNPNPYDGEAYYHLGRALNALGDFDGALDALQKATWNQAQYGCAMQASAELLSWSGQLLAACGYAEKALEQNRLSLKARLLASTLWRRLARTIKRRRSAARR